MKKKHFISLLLSVALITTLLPVPALADQTPQEQITSSETTQETSEPQSSSEQSDDESEPQSSSEQSNDEGEPQSSSEQSNDESEPQSSSEQSNDESETQKSGENAKDLTIDVSDITATSAKLAFTYGKDATVYYLVQESSQDAPEIDTVKKNGARTSEESATAETLTPETDYTVYGMTETDGNTSDVVSAEFTTAALAIAKLQANLLGASAKQYDLSNGNVSITSGGSYVITQSNNSSATANTITVDGADVKITLDNVNIDKSPDGCAFELKNSANVSLTLTGENTLKSGTYYAGLQVPDGSSVTIDGEGSLEATSRTNGAGIGSSDGGAGGTVTISGGTIKTESGNGAGIGGGQYGDGGAVTISGGNVIATSFSGSGIGGGYDGNGGTVDISGGTVTATGIGWGAGIGGGNQGGAGGTVTISGGTVTATGGTDAAGIGGGNGASDQGTCTISGGSVHAYMSLTPQVSESDSTQVFLTTVMLSGAKSATVTSLTTDASYGKDDLKTDADGKLYLWLPSGKMVTEAVIGETTYKGSITAGSNGKLSSATPLDSAVDVSLGNVSITDGLIAYTDAEGAQERSFTADTNITITGTPTTNNVTVDGADVKITLGGVNIDASSSDGCAFELKNSAKVSLTLTGENTLKSGNDYAGLQIPKGSSVTIGGDGSLEAIGGSWYGAGIGGGKGGDGGTVTISGGTVKATSSGGSGIGGGYEGDGGTVTISGGTVTATSDSNGAGIGGGQSGKGGTVTISGGIVTATGGTGAGIGGGCEGDGGTVTISGGTVTATGGVGAGIGGGSGGSNGGTVTISGGTVTATGEYGAGIGGGYDGDGGTVAINSGTVTASSSSGAGIGGGQSGKGGTVTISGGTVKATSSGGAGIGGGKDASDQGTCTIFGGSVYASSMGPTPYNGTASDKSQVYLTAVTLSEIKSATAVTSLTTDASYGTNDLKTDDSGSLYLWLPSGKKVTKAVIGEETYLGSVTTTTSSETSKGTLSIPQPAGDALTVDVSKGNVSITDGLIAYTDTNGSQLKSFTADTNITITGKSTTNNVAVDGADVKITLSGVNIESPDGYAFVFRLEGGAKVSLTLAGTNTLKGKGQVAGLQVPKGSSVTIDGDGSLDASCSSNGAGIGGSNGEDGGTVTISGGTVKATSSGGAGIGGGDESDGGTVAISGGTVSATSEYGAGIGGGENGDGGTVTISGGTVTAKGTSGGAGIGGGNGGKGGTVTISGGTVTATGDTGAAGIGIGCGAIDQGTCAISGGSVSVSSMGPTPHNSTSQVYPTTVTLSGIKSATTVTSLTTDASYGTDDLQTDEDGTLYLWLPEDTKTTAAATDGKTYLGSVTTTTDGKAKGGLTEVTAAGSALTVDVSKGNVSITDGLIQYTDEGSEKIKSFTSDTNITITGTTKTNTVTVDKATAKITIDGVNIDASSTEDSCAFELKNSATVNLTLQGTNTLTSGNNCAGLQVPGNSTVTIDGEGSLKATGGQYGAGIGGNECDGGTVTISGGTVTATGSDGGAGIGGGTSSNGGTVTISGGIVTATGGTGAGIGGGSLGSNGGTVTISGGTVTAKGTYCGAGIGGGYDGDGGTVTISGGTVTASSPLGAGIGGGSGGNGGTVTISGGTVTATSSGGAGIGGGNGASDQGTCTISGGSVSVSSMGPAPYNSTASDKSQVYPTTVTLSGIKSATAVTSLTTDLSDYTYGVKDMQTDKDGTLYLWLPKDTNTTAAAADGKNYAGTVTTTDDGKAQGTMTATSSSSNSGGSSGSNDSSTPKITSSNKGSNQPISSPVQLSTKVDANKNASVTIPTAAVTSAIQKAVSAAAKQGKTSNGVGVSLDIANTAGSNSLSVALPQTVLKQLTQSNVKQCKMTSNLLSLNLDQKTMKQIQSQSTGTVTIHVTPKAGLSTAAKSVYQVSATYMKNGKSTNITNLGTGRVTLSIPYIPGKNETQGYLYGVSVNSQGQVTRIANSVYDANSKSILLTTDSLSAFGIGYAAPSTKYTDIQNHWAKEAVDYVVGCGLFDGSSDTAFSPDAAMTRGDLASALSKLAGADVSVYKTSSFNDVKAGSTYQQSIEWAYKKGIISKIDSNRFAPDQAISRETIAEILTNYARVTGYALPVTRNAVTYKDAASIGEKSAVRTVQQAGIMSAKKDLYFDPKKSITRAETAETIFSYIKLTIDPTTMQGWAKNDSGELMYYKDGAALTGWNTLNGKQYYFDQNGEMIKGA